MATKIHILLIMLLFCVFLTPKQTYACGSHSEKTEKNCCKKHKSNQDKDDCGGKCKHSHCYCSTFNIVGILPFAVEIIERNFFTSNEKQQFYDKQTYYTSDFLPLLLPPKIN